MKRYTSSVVNALTRPFSRKVKLYDSGWKNPKKIDHAKEKVKREKADKRYERSKKMSGFDYL